MQHASITYHHERTMRVGYSAAQDGSARAYFRASSRRSMLTAADAIRPALAVAQSSMSRAFLSIL